MSLTICLQPELLENKVIPGSSKNDYVIELKRDFFLNNPDFSIKEELKNINICDTINIFGAFFGKEHLITTRYVLIKKYEDKKNFTINFDLRKTKALLIPVKQNDKIILQLITGTNPSTGIESKLELDEQLAKELKSLIMDDFSIWMSNIFQIYKKLYPENKRENKRKSNDIMLKIFQDYIPYQKMFGFKWKNWTLEFQRKNVYSKEISFGGFFKKNTITYNIVY